MLFTLLANNYFQQSITNNVDKSHNDLYQTFLLTKLIYSVNGSIT